MTKTVLPTYAAFYEAMLSKTSMWQDLLAEDVKLVGPLAQVAGKDLFIAINTPFFASIQSCEQLQVVEVGNQVITQIVTTVLLPTGETLSLAVSEWYEIQEGKITSLKVYFDTAEFRKALGM